MAAVTDQKSSPDSQLTAYEVGARVYDQIIAIHSHIATVANLYLLVTGVLWSALATDNLGVPPLASIAVLLFHLIGSVAALQMVASSLNAIALRHEFLPAFGERFYPDLEKIGQASFVEIYGSTQSLKARFARWGRQRVLWYLIPIAGFVGSAYFIWEEFQALRSTSGG